MYNKSSLAAFFQDGDIPTGANYSDLIDSQVNLVETSAQAMAGALVTTELITPRVSATAVFATTISAANLFADNFTVSSLNVLGTFSAAAISTPSITASAAAVTGTATAAAFTATGALTGATGVFSGNVSANSLNVTTDVSAVNGSVVCSAVRATRIYAGVGVVSAAGTTQGAAAILTNTINRGKGIADGTTTGFAPPGNNAGMIQYLFNEGASANLWPPVGGTINGLAANAVFPLAASAMVTIVHVTASAMIAK